jgi:DNA replication protein DnaC
MSNHELQKRLSKLGLWYLKDHMTDFVNRAVKGRWSPHQMIEHLVNHELEEYKRRTMERRIASAKIGRFKPMNEFDWSWPKKIDRQSIEALFDLELINQGSNSVLLGPSGCGKTMISKNLAYSAAIAGHSSLFVEASEMLNDLESQETSRHLKLRLAKYTKPKLLVIDELGYLSYTTRSADLLFRVITERYEKSSIIVTTNVPFKDWPVMFQNASCLSPLVDRLLHKCDVFAIDAESYRQKEAKDRKKKRDSKSKENAEMGGENERS